MPQRKKPKVSKADAEMEDGPLFRAVPKFSTQPQTPFLSSYPDVLSDLLSPALTPREFLTRFFRKNTAVFVPSMSGASRVESLRKRWPDPQRLYAETASENVFVWLASPKDHDNGDATPERINSIEVDPDTAFALYQAGHATYCRAPPFIEELLLPALMENTGLGCGQYDASGQSATSMGRAEVETFVSTRAGSTTGWHTDFQENFTIQLSGRKKWSLQRGNVAHVLRAVTPHYRVSAVENQIKAGRLDQEDFAFGPPTIGKNAVGPVEEVILEPGDVLYFPAGMWHRVEVLEPGISINCSLMAKNYANLVCESLHHLLLRSPQWRASVCRPADGSSITNVFNRLLEDLPSIVQRWTREQGAAQGILPPVLHHAEINATISDGADNWTELSDEDTGSVAREDKAVDSAGANDSGSDAGDDDDQIVDLDSEPPDYDATFDPTASPDRLVKNPLALLLDEREVTEHYDTREKANDDHIYILNVNYAGNEAHESHLRLRLRSDEPHLDRMSAQDLAFKVFRRKPNTVAWFVYLGYLVWVPGQS